MPAYPAWRDRVYRGALWVLSLAFLGVAVAIVFREAVLAQISADSALFANIAASWTFLVWVPKWRWFVRGLALLALFGWAVGFPLFLWGGVLAASAIMAAKEYHCFKFWTGRYLPWLSVAAGLAWMLRLGAPLVVLFLAISAGWLGLLWQRAALPLFQIDVQNESTP